MRIRLPKNISIITDGFLVLGSLVFVLGLLSYLDVPEQTASNLPVKSSLTERDVAIADAIEKGQKEYTYTTRFIPGIGMISDPNIFKENWERQAQEDLQKSAP